MSGLSEIVGQYNYLMRRLKNEVQGMIKEETKPLFEKYPELKMGYTSYVPGFNDGDPCEYTFNGVMSYIPNTSWDDLDYDDEQLFRYEDYDSADFLTEPKEVRDFCNTLASLPEEVLRSVFGTDVLVVIDKNGITVEEYDCGY